ncbi:unnamed protein product, partial [Brassica oleracea]
RERERERERERARESSCSLLSEKSSRQTGKISHEDLLLRIIVHFRQDL